MRYAIQHPSTQHLPPSPFELIGVTYVDTDETEPAPDEGYDRLKADGELASVMRGRGL